MRAKLKKSQLERNQEFKKGCSWEDAKTDRVDKAAEVQKGDEG